MLILAYAIYAILIAGFGWGLVDMLVKIHKQPRRPLSILRMSSYPFVPDDETLEAMRREQEDKEPRKLQPVPVPVETNYR